MSLKDQLEIAVGNINSRIEEYVFDEEYDNKITDAVAAAPDIRNVKLQTLPTLQLQIKIIRFLYFLNCNRKLF